MSVVVSGKMVQIKKPHNCWGCTEMFVPPEKMEVVTCTDNGKIYDVYWCEKCQGLLETDEEYCYGDLKESSR